MAKNLTELVERTATADTDLMHINSGGTDYKETKINFLKGDFNHSFDNNSTLTSQTDAIDVTGAIFGGISGYGHQSETGLPINANCYVKAQRMSQLYSMIEIWSINDIQEQHWTIYKNNGTWSGWVHNPSRTEMDNTHTSNRIFRYKEIPTTATAYDCAWQNYYFLVIQAVQWGNIRNSIVIDTSMFSQMSANARPQILDPISNVTYEVYPNGNGSIYAITTSGTSTSALGLDIYGVMAK